MVIEVAVYNLESALRAAEGGADRIELCDNPGEGGTTPSAGMIGVVRQSVSLDVYVMIRPRGGDFCYSNDEFLAMKRDVAQCQKLGADGVVFGILQPDGTLDAKRCRELIERARPLKVTCHRAFDMARDPFEALEDCIAAGFDRILTSGLQPRALEGAGLIGELLQKSAGRIAIMAGSRITEENVGQIVTLSGAEEIHISAVAQRDSPMQFRNDQIAGMGSQTTGEYTLRTVDLQKVKLIRSRAEAASGNRKKHR